MRIPAIALLLALLISPVYAQDDTPTFSQLTTVPDGDTTIVIEPPPADTDEEEPETVIVREVDPVPYYIVVVVLMFVGFALVWIINKIVAQNTQLSVHLKDMIHPEVWKLLRTGAEQQLFPAGDRLVQSTPGTADDEGWESLKTEMRQFFSTMIPQIVADEIKAQNAGKITNVPIVEINTGDSDRG